MTAQQSLQRALGELLGPEARSHGYRGSAPTWRRRTPADDWAVVNVQSSSASTASSLRCVVNLGFAPEPWLRWQRELLGPRMPRSVPESLGLYGERLHPAATPPGADGWWAVHDDDSAREAVSDMNVQLELGGWPVLAELLTPGFVLSQLQAGQLGQKRRARIPVWFARAEALLLMDAGATDALEERLSFALGNVTPGEREHAERFDGWVRSQVSARR